MSPRLTNIEVVTELMQFSRHGALAQVFIIEAIPEAGTTNGCERS